MNAQRIMYMFPIYLCACVCVCVRACVRACVRVSTITYQRNLNIVEFFWNMNEQIF